MYRLPNPPLRSASLVLIVPLPRRDVLHAQDNYEIQVYPSETIAPKTLLTELHSNYTVEGSTTPSYGMLPTQGQEHETIELTQGITDWSEVGFYIFTAEQKRQWRAMGGRPYSSARARSAHAGICRWA